MGLLDSFFGTPEQTQALGLLGAGLMQGNSGAAFQNAISSLSPDAQAARQFKQMQVQNMQSEIAQRNAAMARADQDYKFGMALFNGGAGMPGGLGGGAPAGGQAGGAPGAQPNVAGIPGGGQGDPVQALSSPQGKTWLSRLSEDQVAGLIKMGHLPAGTEKLWEIAKFGKDYKQGDFRIMSDGSQSMVPMVKEGLGYGPGGVSVLDGAAQAQSALTFANEDAKARAQAGNDLTQVWDPTQKRNVFVRRSDVLKGQGGGSPQPTAPSQGVVSPQSGVNGNFAGDPAKIMADIIAIRDPQERANAMAAFTEQAKRTQGFSQGAPFAAGPSMAETNAGASDKTYGENVAKDVVEQRKSIMNADFSAPGNIAKYQKLGQLLSDVDGGKFTPAGTEVASAINSLGLKIDKNLGNKQAAAAIANEAALQLRSTSGGAGMPGAMSDQDRNFLVSMTPNMTQSTEGRKQVIDSYIAVQRRNQQVATFARNYEKKYGKLDNGFFDQLSAWSSQNPLFGGK